MSNLTEDQESILLMHTFMLHEICTMRLETMVEDSESVKHETLCGLECFINKECDRLVLHGRWKELDGWMTMDEHLSAEHLRSLDVENKFRYSIDRFIKRIVESVLERA